MFKFNIWFLFYQIPVLLLLVKISHARVLLSPCPNVFTYEKNNYEGHPDWIFPSDNHIWKGVVRVNPIFPIILKIKLLVPALLPTKYVGKIELFEDKEKVVNKIKNKSLEKIKYYVYFPSKIPIPEVILIEVNSHVICSQIPVPRRLKTILILEHSLIPAAGNVSLRTEIGKYNSSLHFSFNKEFIDKSFNSDLNCGKRNVKNYFMERNSLVSIGDWPWMVPLFKKTLLGLQFFCSSTLISYSLALTAAHCIKFKNFLTVKLEDIIAYVGKLDITNWTEENSQPRLLNQIHIHPDFDSDDLHSDLAIIKFNKPVNPASNVAPACLWQGNDNLSAVVGKKGVVFGWGADGTGNKLTSMPKLAVMPIISQEECLRSKMEFLFLTTNRTFCAGFRNGTGPCSGDSGGGLLLPQRDNFGNLRWFLRGIISLSLLQDSSLKCDVHQYSVFTDVAKYQNWILNYIEN